MTSHAQRRRRKIAAQLNVSKRNAANIIQVRTAEKRTEPGAVAEPQVVTSEPIATPLLSGDQTPLAFTCLTCKTVRDLPLREFASGRIFCPTHDTPQEYTIPNNGRYRRLAREIESITNLHRDAFERGIVSLRLVAISTEPYLVVRQLSRIEVAHVDAFQTRLLAVGHWNGSGLSWDKPVNGNLSVAVLKWLSNAGKSVASQDAANPLKSLRSNLEDVVNPLKSLKSNLEDAANPLKALQRERLKLEEMMNPLAKLEEMMNPLAKLEEMMNPLAKFVSLHELFRELTPKVNFKPLGYQLTPKKDSDDEDE